MSLHHRRTTLLGLTCLLAVSAMAPMLAAHSGATGVVKARMDLMKDMADAMKTMGAMVKGEAPFEPAVMVENASYLADHAQKIPETTPEGSDEHPSEILPVTWQDWEGYVASADELGDEGSKLAAMADAGADPSALRAQFARVSQTCGRCHDRFRKPKS